MAAQRRGAYGNRGGDFYTLAVRRPGRIGVVIGDTCGRGAEGEALLRPILPKVHELALSGLAPSDVLHEMNRMVSTSLPVDRFVTAAAFEFDLRARVLTVANAAHVPALVRRGFGRGSCSLVGEASGIPLGIDLRTRYVDAKYSLERGDVIVLMTDGILEAVESDLVTMRDLRCLLAEAAGDIGVVHRYLLSKVYECTGGVEADDMTLVALEALAAPSNENFAWAS